jgi:hypothetical protein
MSVSEDDREGLKARTSLPTRGCRTTNRKVCNVD